MSAPRTVEGLTPGYERPGERSASPLWGMEAARWVRASSIDDALRALDDAAKAGETVKLLAGGTDLIVDGHLHGPKATRIDAVVDVSRVDELRQIARDPNTVEDRFVLGGGVTYWQLRHDSMISSRLPMLAEMARDVGAVQIQTRGTLAGNIATASPAADGAAALMALDAILTLVSRDGTRTMPLESFFTGYRKTVLLPNELIASISVRVPQSGAHVSWRKVGTRMAQSIAKVALASVVNVEKGRIERARFGAASVAATTHPLARTRTYVEGKRLSEMDRDALAAVIAKDVTPIDDVRSTGAYRTHVLSRLVWRVLVAGD